MAELIRRRWEARFDGMTRRDRPGCTYDAYLPDPLAGWELTLPSDVAADIDDAEAAIRDRRLHQLHPIPSKKCLTMFRHEAIAFAHSSSTIW